MDLVDHVGRSGGACGPRVVEPLDVAEHRRKSPGAWGRKERGQGDDRSPAPSCAYRSRAVATEKPKRRKAAPASSSRTVKTSLTLDVDLHSRLSLAAALAGMSNTAYVADVLREALKGLIVIDKRSSRDDVDPSGKLDRVA